MDGDNMTFNVLTVDKKVQKLTLDQLGELIVKESRKGAEKYRFKHGVDVHDMEDWLITEIYQEVMRNKNMQNIKGIRYIIRLRSVDYMRELVRDNVCETFSSLSSSGATKDDMYSFSGFLEGYGSDVVCTDPFDNYHESSEMKDFLNSLELQDRQIVELSAGITDSLDVSQITRVKNMIDKKAVCKCGSANCQHNVNVWFTATEVGEILGLSRRQVQYPLSKMSERALDFGLWY